jgi:AraC-like DNA-binding protein
VSHKQFIEQFRREVGLTPKLFCRIRRFQEVLGLIHSQKTVNWADVACSCGYFDQAHFVNDFLAFAGLNPSAYLDRRLEEDQNFVRARCEEDLSRLLAECDSTCDAEPRVKFFQYN